LCAAVVLGIGWPSVSCAMRPQSKATHVVSRDGGVGVGGGEEPPHRKNRRWWGGAPTQEEQELEYYVPVTVNGAVGEGQRGEQQHTYKRPGSLGQDHQQMSLSITTS
jgi:hypothetical protein